MKEELNQPFWYIAIAGLCVLFTGIGLCRFAYTPLIPVLIHEGWVDTSGAGYLGAINLIGYLLGAFLGQRANKYFQTSHLIKYSLVASVISLGMCAINWNFAWFAIWRFVAGMTGALIMVMTPAAILKSISIRYRGRAAGLMFTGIGFGIIVSGFLFPSLAKLSVSMAWLSAAVVAFAATVFSWRAFPSITNNSHDKLSLQSTASSEPLHPPHNQNTITLLSIAYVLYGIGMVPHTLFLVDYIHRELAISLVASGMFWSLFGIGATLGPLCAGFVADKIGIYKSLTGAFLLACIAILMIIFNHITVFYILSSFLMGVLLTSIPSLLSSRILELVGIKSHPLFWGKVTLYCAVSQAAAAYIMSYFLRGVPAYTACFFIADLVFIIGLIAVAYANDNQHSTE